MFSKSWYKIKESNCHLHTVANNYRRICLLNRNSCRYHYVFPGRSSLYISVVELSRQRKSNSNLKQFASLHSLHIFTEPPSPTNLHSTNADTTSITIEWTPPDPPLGVIMGYEIQYWKVNGVVMFAFTNATEYTVTGLQVDEMLSFQVSRSSYETG